jgi:hypothetical protein
MTSRTLGICLVALLVAACAGTTATPTEPAASPSPEATATATASASPSATASASPTEEPSEPAASGEECESEPPTAESEDWTEHVGVTPDYRFSTPAEWVEREGTSLEIVTAVSPTSFETIGFPDFAIMPVDLITAPDGSIGVSAWVIESRIDTPTDELFDDELAWLADQPQIVEVLDDSLETCLDGSEALGFSSTWAFPDGERYIEVYLLQRNGKVYETQLTARDDSGSETFAEVLRTWQWEEPLDGGGNGDGGSGDTGDLGAELDATDFDAAVLMSDFDQTDWPGRPPPQSESEGTFDPDGRIWAVYKLDEGVADTVLLTWYFEGEAATDASRLDYDDETAYAWGYLDPGSGGFDAGDWEAVFELEEGGDRLTLPFEVTD